jgi:hypothetical protein
MYFYQLKAYGQLACFNRKEVFYSSTIFSSKELALKRIDKFREIVCDESKLVYFDRDSVEITVNKLEVIE